MPDNLYIPQSGLNEIADAIIDAIFGAGLVPYTKLMDGTVDGTNKAIVDANGGLRTTLYGTNAAAGDKSIAASSIGAIPVTASAGSVADNSSGSANGFTDISNIYRPTAVIQMLLTGANADRQRTPSKFISVSLVAGTAETTIWTPTAGKKFRLMGFILTCGAASTLTFKDGTGGTTIFAARGTTDIPIATPPFGNGILSALANNVLTVTRGTSATLDGTVWGTEE